MATLGDRFSSLLVAAYPCNITCQGSVLFEQGQVRDERTPAGQTGYGRKQKGGCPRTSDSLAARVILSLPDNCLDLGSRESVFGRRCLDDEQRLRPAERAMRSP